MSDITRQLDRIERLLLILTYENRRLLMAAKSTQDALDEVTAAVAAETQVDASVITFISSVPTLIANAVAQAVAAGATPAQLAAFDELSTTMAANSAALTAAVVANTPAVPAPTPTPPPPDQPAPTPDVPPAS